MTLGFCYEKKSSFAGGAYHPVVRRLETFEDEPLKNVVKQHEKRAAMVLELEEKVSTVVQRLKDRGLTSPYLRTFVVARINPLRWIKGQPPPLEDVLKTMRDRAAKFNVEKILQEDLASMAGAAAEQSARTASRRTRACSPASACSPPATPPRSSSRRTPASAPSGSASTGRSRPLPSRADDPANATSCPAAPARRTTPRARSRRLQRVPDRRERALLAVECARRGGT